MAAKRLLLKSEKIWLEKHTVVKSGSRRCKTTGAVIRSGDVTMEVVFSSPDLAKIVTRRKVVVTLLACPECPLPTSPMERREYITEDEIEEE